MFATNQNVKAFTGSGSGTELDPYQITNANELNQTWNDLDANYSLMNNIDLGLLNVENWNSGKGFIPISKTFILFEATPMELQVNLAVFLVLSEMEIF
jgi:hypothetical protein